MYHTNHVRFGISRYNIERKDISCIYLTVEKNGFGLELYYGAIYFSSGLIFVIFSKGPSHLSHFVAAIMMLSNFLQFRLF